MRIYNLLYEKIYLKTLTTIGYIPDFLSKLNYLRKTQYYSADQLKTLTDQRLTAIVRRAYNESDFYKEKYTSIKELIYRNDFSSAGLSNIPILEKEELRGNIEKIIPQKNLNSKVEYRTGGTTGEFLKIFIPKDILKTYSLAAAMRSWEWIGFRPGDKYVRIWGLPVDINEKKSVKSKIKDFIERKIELNAFLLDNKKCIEYIKKIVEFKPNIILSHATPLTILSNCINEMNIKIKGVKAILTTAEMLMPTERYLIENTFNCQLFDYYGNRETNLIAQQCYNKDCYHISSENGIIEVVDANGLPVNEGETGDVLITDFYNYVMPLIRYKIGDLAVATYKKCECGLELPLIKKFVGRKLEIIKTKNGRFIPGEFFLLLFDRYPWIIKAQVVQEAIDKIELKIAINERPVDIDKQKKLITREMVNYMGEISVSIIEEDPNNFLKSGKHRWVISKIK